MRSLMKSTAAVVSLAAAMSPAFAQDIDDCLSEGKNSNDTEVIEELLLTPSDELADVVLTGYSANMLGRVAVEISDDRLDGMMTETNRVFNALANDFRDGDDLDFDDAVENSPLAAADVIRSLEAGEVNVVSIDQAALSARIAVVNHVSAVLGRVNEDYTAKSQLCLNMD